MGYTSVRTTAAIQGFVKGSHQYASIRPEHFLALEMPVPSLVDLIELQRKVSELEKINRSISKSVDSVLKSTYETLFENADSRPTNNYRFRSWSGTSDSNKKAVMEQVYERTESIFV